MIKPSHLLVEIMKHMRIPSEMDLRRWPGGLRFLADSHSTLHYSPIRHGYRTKWIAYHQDCFLLWLYKSKETYQL